SRRRHTRFSRDWSSDVCSSDLFYYIEKRDDEYRCARDSGRNPTSVRVKIDTLSARCFSTNLNGDIITLVQSKLYTKFTDTIKKRSEERRVGKKRKIQV